MPNVVFYKDKLVFHYERNKKIKYPTSELVRFLWEPVVCNSITVRDILEVIRCDVQFWAKALQEPYLINLISYYEKMQNKSIKAKLDAVRISWILEFWKWDRKDKKVSKYWRDELSINLAMDGVATEKGKRVIYGLSFTPLEDILNAKIEIDDKANLNTRKCGKYVVQDLGYMPVTVLDLFKAVIYEITWHGTEENKKQEGEKIRKRIEDVESGRAKCYPIEEVFARIRKKLKKGKKK